MKSFSSRPARIAEAGQTNPDRGEADLGRLLGDRAGSMRFVMAASETRAYHSVSHRVVATLDLAAGLGGRRGDVSSVETFASSVEALIVTKHPNWFETRNIHSATDIGFSH